MAGDEGEKADGDAALAWLPHAQVGKYRLPCGGNPCHSMTIFARSAASAAYMALNFSSLTRGSAVSVSLCTTSSTHSALVISGGLFFGAQGFLSSWLPLVVRGPLNILGAMVGCGSRGAWRELRARGGGQKKGGKTGFSRWQS